MFLLTITEMSEFMMINSSQFGCIKSILLTRLRKMYTGSSCPNLGIGIKISNASINSAIIDPNEGCCLVRWTSFLQHIIPKAGGNLKKNTKESFHVLRFDDAEEKVAVRFEGEKDPDAIYKITLCQYLDPENKLPINPSIRC